MIITIATRELRSLFLSPLAWAILGVMQFIIAWLCFSTIDYFLIYQARYAHIPGTAGVTDIVIMHLFFWVGFLSLTIIPIITMRLISEERRGKTITLLLSAPVTSTHIILGKFSAVISFAFLILIQIYLVSLPLAAGTNLDYGQIASASIGLMLMLSAFTAVGLYISCLTSYQSVAAVVTFGILIVLLIIYIATALGGEKMGPLSWFSMLYHQSSFQRGLINSGDVVYYLIIIGIFLLLGIRRLDAERLQA